jgi:hypothetical protein
MRKVRFPTREAGAAGGQRTHRGGRIEGFVWTPLGSTVPWPRPKERRNLAVHITQIALESVDDGLPDRNNPGATHRQVEPWDPATVRVTCRSGRRPEQQLLRSLVALSSSMPFRSIFH